MEAVLGLEDGTVVEGDGVGVEGEVTGELVFATPFTGYTESLTDPSYRGQLLMFAYPLIGNYGVNRENFQSDGIEAEAMVAREVCENPSGSDLSVQGWMEEEGVTGIEGVDTRELTVKTREQGAMRAALVAGNSASDRTDEVVEMAKEADPISELDLVPGASVEEIDIYEGSGPSVAVLDLGSKSAIVNSLRKRDCEVQVFPHDASWDEVEAEDPDALLISNGPGDPERCTDAIRCVSDAAGELPIAGICFGHQIAALALGAETYKLKFGHRGANQPVKHFDDGRVRITSQNHGFAVDGESLPEELEVTAVNVNDETVEGLKSDYLDVETVQYHPEAYPGPRDTESEFFDRVVKRAKGGA